MFSSLETIFSTAETMVEVPETMFSAVETLVSTIKAKVSLVETTVGVTQTPFPEAEHIFYASETGFSITKKILGEVLAAFVHPSKWDYPEDIIDFA